MQNNKVAKTLLKIEDSARRYFERFPFIHAFLAGVGVILFWRGIWEVADIEGLGPVASIIVGIILLTGIGLFIQTFVGNAIIIKNVKHEIKLEQKNKKETTDIEEEVKKEEVTLAYLCEKLDNLTEKIENLEKRF